MTTPASLATNPALPLLAQRELGIGVAMLVIGGLFLCAGIWFRVEMAHTDDPNSFDVLVVLMSAAFAFALVFIGLGIPKVVAPRGMALGAQVYGSRKAGS